MNNYERGEYDALERGVKACKILMDKLAAAKADSAEWKEQHENLLAMFRAAEADAVRWRWWVSRTGAVNNELKFPTPDVNRHLVGVNLMRGSVAEHYSKAIDAAIRHGSVDSGGAPKTRSDDIPPRP